MSEDGTGLVPIATAIFGEVVDDRVIYDYLVKDTLTRTTPSSEACKLCTRSYSFPETGTEMWFGPALHHRLTCTSIQ